MNIYDFTVKDSFCRLRYDTKFPRFEKIKVNGRDTAPLYKYLKDQKPGRIMAPELREYAENLDPAMVGRIVLFTTSNWSRRTVLALKKIFRGKGITVSEDYFYAHMLNIDGKINAARKFGAENC